MEERKITERESLEVITSMIARTKQHYIGDGNIMLLWGYLTATVSALVWIMLVATHQQVWNWLWFAIPVIGGIATPIMARKQLKTSGVVTYTDKVTSRLWTIFGLSEFVLIAICLGFTFIGGIDCWLAMLAYSIIAAPIAEIAQGLIINEKCMTAGGSVGLAVGLVTICCVAGGVPLGANWYMPLFILAFIAMMIIPGHIINAKSKSHQTA